MSDLDELERVATPTSRSTVRISSHQKERGPAWATPFGERRFWSIAWHLKPVLGLAKEEPSAKHAGAFDCDQSHSPKWALSRAPEAQIRLGVGEPGRKTTFTDRTPTFERYSDQDLALVGHGLAVLVPVGMFPADGTKIGHETFHRFGKIDHSGCS